MEKSEKRLKIKQVHYYPVPAQDLHRRKHLFNFFFSIFLHGSCQVIFFFSRFYYEETVDLHKLLSNKKFVHNLKERKETSCPRKLTKPASSPHPQKLMVRP